MANRKKMSGNEAMKTKRQRKNTAGDFYVPVLKHVSESTQPRVCGLWCLSTPSLSYWLKAPPGVLIPLQFQPVLPLGRADSSNQNPQAKGFSDGQLGVEGHSLNW